MSKTTWRRCLQKVGYANEGVAARIVGELREKWNDDTLEVYLCNFKGHYHIGHPTPANPTPQDKEME